MTIFQELEGLRLDAIIELYELHVTMTNGVVVPTRWCNYADTNGNAAELRGFVFPPWPMQGSPIDNKVKGTLPQFSIEIADYKSVILALIDQNRPDNAPLVVRRIFAKHLDGGAEPNWQAQFAPLLYRYNYCTVDLNVTMHFTVSAVNGLNTEVPTVSYADL